jgi:hypothetical protein
MCDYQRFSIELAAIAFFGCHQRNLGVGGGVAAGTAGPIGTGISPEPTSA